VTVRIVTDSACDLRGDEVAEFDIEVVPLSIRFGDKEYVDREELSVSEFYRLMEDSEDLPETSAPSPGRFAEAFQRQLDAGADSVVCINISAALSATMQSAQTAADQMESDIRVVDSRSITAGLGSIVIAAAEMAAAGSSVDEIVDAVNSLSDRTQLYGALDTLDNLKKGGRIGGAQAMIGSILSIKPIIDISTGVVEEAGKQRTRKKSLGWLRDKIAEVGPIESLAVMHGEAPDIDEFLSMIADLVDLESTRIEKIGPVVGTHGGPRVMGIAIRTPA
jgi:DegV family protein with EDD domain